MHSIYCKFSEILAALGILATMINLQDNYWGISPIHDPSKDNLPSVSHQVNFIDIKKTHLDLQSLQLILDYK